MKNSSFLNPNGVSSPSPGLRVSALPWVGRTYKTTTPTGLPHQWNNLCREATPLGLGLFFTRKPRVDSLRSHNPGLKEATPLGLKCLLLALFFLAAPCVFASNQWPDKILHNGKEYEISVNPLEAYFVKYPEQKKRYLEWHDVVDVEPLSHDEVIAFLEEKFPDEASEIINDEKKLDKWAITLGKRTWRRPAYGGPSLNRGYIATFEIKDGQLYWKVENGLNEDKDPFKDMFPGETELKADWVTGVLATTGYSPRNLKTEIKDIVRENRLVFEFEEGKLISERSMNRNEYTNFVQTDEYRTIRDKMKKEGYTNIHFWFDVDNWDDSLTIWMKNRKNETPDVPEEK